MAEKMPPKTGVLELPLGTTSKCCSFQILGPFSDELGMGLHYLQEVSRSHRAGVEGFLVPAFAFCVCPPLRNTKEKKWGKARKECIPSKIHTHYHLGPVYQDCLILWSSGPMEYRKPMERQISSKKIHFSEEC